MKRSSIVWQVALLAAIGCSGPTETAQTTAPETTAATETVNETTPDTVPGDGEAVTLVSLSVPNMH